MKYEDCKKVIIKEFFNSSKILDTPDGTVTKILDFLLKPEAIAAMELMTKFGHPALAGVVKELEEEFAKSDFPLHHNGPYKNSANRRNVGWMVRFVMGKFGYVPKKSSGSDRHLPKFAGSQYFGSAAVYEETGKAEYELVLACEEIGNKEEE